MDRDLLKLIIDTYYAGSQRDFSRKTGLSESYLSKFLGQKFQPKDGGAKVTEEMSKKFRNALDKVFVSAPRGIRDELFSTEFDEEEQSYEEIIKQEIDNYVVWPYQLNEAVRRNPNSSEWPPLETDPTKFIQNLLELRALKYIEDSTLVDKWGVYRDLPYHGKECRIAVTITALEHEMRINPDSSCLVACHVFQLGTVGGYRNLLQQLSYQIVQTQLLTRTDRYSRQVYLYPIILIKDQKRSKTTTSQITTRSDSKVRSKLKHELHRYLSFGIVADYSFLEWPVDQESLVALAKEIDQKLGDLISARTRQTL